MKKDFFKVSLLLTMAIICVLVFKYTEAAVTATIDASKTSALVGDSAITITYSSSGADSCKVYLGSTLVSSNSSGSLTLPTTTPGTYTYSISCIHTVVEPTYYYYQLSPCNSAYPAAEYYALAGAWSTGTLVQGATGAYYTIAGSNTTDNLSKTNVAGITKETDWSLCK